MSRRAARAPIALIAAGVVAAGAASLARPGYTPDEEYTLFAVRGIAAHGVPLLPSRFLYDRGLLYSYAAWLAGSISGAELPSFRLLALLAAAGTVVVGGSALAGRLSAAAGLAAAALAAVSVPFVAAATSGRFYAPFLLAWIASLAIAARIADADATAVPVRRLLALAAVAAGARLTHELAFTLLALPVAAAALQLADAGGGTPDAGARRPTRPEVPWGVLRPAARTFAALSGGLLAAQILIFALHAAAPGPGSNGAMIERFFLWQVLNLFERPRGGGLGVVLSAALVACVIAPGAARRVWRPAAVASILALAAAAWNVRAHHSAWPGWRELAASGLNYPLDMFWHMVTATPIVVALAVALIGARLLGLGGDWPARERVLHLTWMGWVLWFGVIESGITTSYLLLPTTFLMAAVGTDLVALGEHARAVRPGRVAQAARAGLTALALLVVAEQWSGAGSAGRRLAAARPTLAVAGLDAVRDRLRPDDLVACTDELACLLLVGRVDAWLALDDYVRERFVIVPDTVPVGVYAGAPAVFSLTDLLPDGQTPRPSSLAGLPAGRVVVVDVFKDYPVGRSAAWLPRALGASQLTGHTWLETAQMRVVEVSRPPSGGGVRPAPSDGTAARRPADAFTGTTPGARPLTIAARPR